MDKLKPVLKQIFWILFGIALLIPVIGWFLGTGTMAEAIEQRISTLNGLNPTPGATVPNDSWITQVAAIKEEREKRLETASDYLWSQQRQYMTWPRRMQPEVEGKLFEEAIDVRGLEIYRRGFNQQVDELRAIVDPYEIDEMTYRPRGKVALEYAALPLPEATSQWPGGPPTSKEVWYLQEDIWLLRGLLESVRDTNLRAGSDANILKVPIKEIVSIELQGGNPEALEAMSSDEAGMEGMEGEMGSPGMSMGGMGTSMDGMGMGEEGMGGGAAAGLDFPLEEEVGPATPVMAGDDMEGEMGSSGMEMGSSGMEMGMSMGMGMGGEGANSITDLKRYVHEGDLPYKTRAFKMTVIMDHRQLPEFMVELTNSPFPVRILRVNWAQLNEEQLYAGATGGGYGGESEMMGGGRPGARGGLGASGARGTAGRGMGGLSAGGRSGFGGGPMSGASRGGAGIGSRPFGAAGGRGMSAGIGNRGSSFGRGSSGMRGPSMSRPGRGGMGGMPPRGPMMGSGGLGLDEGGGMMGTETQADLYGQAMQDPYLAQVVIGGLMTIYRDPAEVEAAAEGTLEIAEEGTESTGGALPEEGAMTDDAAPEGGLDSTGPEPAGAEALDPEAVDDPNVETVPPSDPAMSATDPTATEEDPVAAEDADTAAPLDEGTAEESAESGGANVEDPSR